MAQLTVRLHTITDHLVEVTEDADALRKRLLLVHDQGGMEGLSEEVKGLLVKEKFSVITSHGLEVGNFPGAPSDPAILP